MTSSPWVGVFRDSMLLNPRIIKPPLGKNRSRGFSIPGPDFTYGLSTGQDEGGVAQVLSSWNVVSRRGHSASVLPPVDFVTLNRNAVKSGLVTAKELSRYRAQRPPPRVQPITRQHQSDQPTTAQGRQGLVPDITFGLVGRPDSALDLLLAHEYGQRWIREQLKRNEMENRRLSAARVKLSTITDTRTSLLRKTHSLPQNTAQILPRTSRYSKVGPALQTFREPKSRTRALEALEREAGSRRGQGRGVYNLD